MVVALHDADLRAMTTLSALLVLRLRMPLSFIAVVVLLAGCGGDNEIELDLPPIDGTPTSEATDTETSTAVTEAPAGNGDYTPVTASFDIDNPPDELALADVLFESVTASETNILWCYANLADCDVEKHIGPSITEPRSGPVETDILRSFPDGVGSYEPGELDGIYPVEVIVVPPQEFEIADEFRLVGLVTTCEVYNGTFKRPGDDVTLDTAMKNEYIIWQKIDGVLKVNSQSETDRGEIELCDPFKPDEAN